MEGLRRSKMMAEEGAVEAEAEMAPVELHRKQKMWAATAVQTVWEALNQRDAPWQTRGSVRPPKVARASQASIHYLFAVVWYHAGRPQTRGCYV